jgi:replicative DNA helicase Mcm
MDGKKKKQEELVLEAKSFFNAYKKEIGRSLRKEDKAVRINFPQLLEFSPMLSDNLLEFPEETIAAIETALEESNIAVEKNFRVRITDLPLSSFIKIREIRAKHLDRFLWIEGIVRQASDVRPQVVNAKFECPNCGAILSVLQIEKKFREPSRCSCGWKGPFKILSKEMVDAQRLVVEESPDTLEGGEQPRRINIFLKEDLVDPKMEERTTPGSKIMIYGVLKEVPVPLQTGAISTRYDIAIEANNVTPLEESFESLDVNEEEVKQILELAADPKIFRRLTESIAPSVYGDEMIKEALLLQLFGGIKKMKSDGGSTRGDIHILLVGDPGVAKSVLLKFISTIGPKGRYVSGKSASAAGLCVSPNSIILANPGGMQRIQDIVERRLENPVEYAPGVWKEDNVKDIKIQSLSNELKVHSKNPQTIWKLKAPEKVYEVKLRSGKKIELTGNTQLFVLENGETKWKKSMELKLGEFVATPRRLIGGDVGKQYFAEFIHANPVVHNVKDFVSIIAGKLKEKHGTIRAAAEKLNLNENNLYHNWREEGARGNIKINDLRRISEDVGIEWRDKIKKISLYNGKNHLLPVYVNRDILYLAGLIAGDGDLRAGESKTCSIRLSNSNKDLQNEFRRIVLEQFGFNCNVTLGNGKRPEASRFQSKIVGEFLNKLGIPFSPKSNKIEISNELLHFENSLLAEYIAGLYDTDGSVYIREGQGSDCIDFTTCSEKLARQIQLALTRYEIHANLRERPPSINEKIKGKYNKWILEIRSHEGIRKFKENINLRHPEKRKKLDIICSKEKNNHSNIDLLPGVGNILKKFLKDNHIGLRSVKWHLNLSRNGLKSVLDSLNIENSAELDKFKKLAESDILWDSIAEIKEKTPEYEYVYDLTVEDSHNFVVDGVLVHNTASVVKDEFLRGWSLEAGAMVLSNKGMVCIDEIEKMTEQDRSTMHEAMEQQTVTIAKANIQARLRAETTVLAAGNPKLGRFNPSTPIPQQIDISPALLSRFDVIFIMRDMPNKTQDEAIASHVLEEHKQEVIRDIIEPKLFRKYISYAKRFKPKLSEAASDEIKSFYVHLRNQSIKSDADIKPIPVTARQLEGIIRLSEACAKLRLSNEVTRDDAKKAIDLLKVSLMQVGYDEEMQAFDVDKIMTGVSSAQRSKIYLVREAIAQLESRIGKLIPIEELIKIIGNRMNPVDLEDSILKLEKESIIFRPKKGYIQKL